MIGAIRRLAALAARVSGQLSIPDSEAESRRLIGK
jgi:hypothetical protein